MRGEEGKPEVVQPPLAESPRTRRPMQWTVGGLILLTTITAIAIAGFVRQGVAGAVGALFLVHMIMLGILVAIHGLFRAPRSVAAVGIGIALLGAGVYGWIQLAKTKQISLKSEMAGVRDRLFATDIGWSLLGIAAVAIGVWLITRPKWMVTIAIDPHGVSVDGVAAAKREQVVEFVRRDLALPGKATIYVRRQPNGLLDVRLSGVADPRGVKQRVRNYFHQIL